MLTGNIIEALQEALDETALGDRLEDATEAIEDLEATEQERLDQQAELQDSIEDLIDKLDDLDP